MVAALLDESGGQLWDRSSERHQQQILAAAYRKSARSTRTSLDWRNGHRRREGDAAQRNRRSSRRARRPAQAAGNRAASSSAAKRLRPPRLLTYVDAVARHGSIRKAADALNVASSALNRQILDLEADLGSALVRATAARRAADRGRRSFLAYARPGDFRAQGRRIDRSSNCAAWCAARSASPPWSRSPASCCRPRSRSFSQPIPIVRFNVRIGAPEELAAA